MDKHQAENDLNEEGKIDIFRMILHIWTGFKKYWWVIPLVAGIFAYRSVRQVSSSFIPSYQAKSTFTVSVRSGDSIRDIESSYSYYNNSGTASQMALTFPYIVQSQVFQEILANDLEKGFVNGAISVTTIPNSNIFTIVVTSNNEEDAYNILNSVIENYPQVARYVIGDTKLTLLQPAKVTQTTQIQTVYRRGLMREGIKGALIGCIPMLLFAFTRNEVHNKEDIKKSLNLYCLGTVPKVQKKRRSKKQPSRMNIKNKRLGSAFDESFKIISSRIVKEMNLNEAKVLMITSTHPEEGKSVISSNVAAELAGQGKKVVLIDGDLRKGSLTEQMDDSMKSCNLVEILDNKVTIDSIQSILEKDHLYVITSTAEHKKPVAVLKSKEFEVKLEELKEIADYIIIDTPPVGLMADAMIISEYADGGVYVIRQDYSNKNHIRNALAGLASSNIKLYGCVLNYATEGMGNYYYSRYRKYGNK